MVNFPARRFVATLLAAILWSVSAIPSLATGDEVVGRIRVEFLSPTLVRLEVRGPNGFENRNTFTVVKRPKSLPGVERSNAGGATVSRGEISVNIPNPDSLTGVTVSKNGKVVYECDGGAPPVAFLPGPVNLPDAIPIADWPRIVPPKWGASAPPANNQDHPDTSGWDLSNQAFDVYVFIPTSYAQFRKEFLDLTGPTELPPLYAFGLWHSRYHPYSEQEALDVIDKYRALDIPLDNFVVDTDWRVGASDGYAVNKKLFPDMARFLKEAHDKHVHTMFNDHPEPISQSATDPKELNFRQDGLDSLLSIGADVWWYDRNWSTSLREPAPGLAKEVWGAAMFHDMTQAVKLKIRPLIMSNVPGIDNGQRHYPPHPAAHRYPVWWTGDTSSNFTYLRNGVANAVDGGVESLLPYMSEDLGGHFGNPTPELYTRFMEYGALSPQMRLHCTSSETRDPWAFGKEAQDIVHAYTKLRYSLLPTLYSASRRNYEDGTPIVRRCDLEWPSFREASAADQYLLGDDILVAPILTSMQSAAIAVPASMFRTAEGESGLQGDYFENRNLDSPPKLTRVDPDLNFDWGDGAPGPGLPLDNFSVRWTGRIGPVPVSGSYEFVTTSDDGVRLWVDGQPVISQWRDMDHGVNHGTIVLQAGITYTIQMEFYDSGGQAVAKLGWITPDVPRKDTTDRQVWIPPGTWVNLWDDTAVAGPKTIAVSSSLAQTPMWQRVGSIVFLAPEMAYTGEKPWDPITIDAYVPESGSVKRELYEDDGISNDYKSGKFSKTEVELSRDGKTIRLHVSSVKGEKYEGRIENRAWRLHLHVRGIVPSCEATLNGKHIKCDVVQPSGRTPSDIGVIPMFPFDAEGDLLDSSMIRISLASAPTSESQTIEIKLP